MANYFVPRVQIEQEFTQNTVFTTQPLSALIIGPQYKLSRYAEEKAATVVYETVSPTVNLNNYVGTQREYGYQGKATASVVDLDYLKVFFDSAQLEYYSTASAVVVDSVKKNQISSASQVYKTGYGDTRTTAADVMEGDTVVLWNAVSAPTYTLTTKVRSVTASMLAATVPGTATATAGGNTEDPEIDVLISGDFTGTKDITYRIICTTGGAYGTAVVKVLSDNVDSAGPFVVDDSTGVAHSPKYALGTQGLYFDFVPVAPGADLLVTGDEWTVKIVASTPDKYNIIELEDNIPTTNWSTPYLASIRISVDGVSIPAIRDLNAGTTNWTASQTGVLLKSAITATNSRVAVAEVLTPLTVKSALVYVERRDLVKDNVATVGSVASLGAVETQLGTVHPDNDLAQGVYNATLNSSTAVVYYIGVGSNDLTGYNKALEIAKKDKIYHGLAPLTDDATIIDAFAAHVVAMSDSKQAKWREVFIGRSVADSATLYGAKSNGNQWTAYVSIVPGGTAYSYVTLGYDTGSALVPDAESKLLTDGVRAGDKVLYNYHIDPISSEIAYDEATVVDVTSQNTIIVDKDWASAQSVPFKIEIRRDYTSSEKAAAYKTILSNYNDRRIIPVFPDVYKAGTVTQKGYHLAAAIAGLASGVVPHQSLTNIQVLGPTDLTRVVSEFTEAELDSIADEGCLIVTQAAIGSPAYIRHQLTSDRSQVSKAENSVTRNVDSVSYGLQEALAPFIGIYNINAGSLLKVRAAIDKNLNSRVSNTSTETAGPQLLGYTINKVERDVTFQDKLVIEVQLQVPFPMNYITVTLLV